MGSHTPEFSEWFLLENQDNKGYTPVSLNWDGDRTTQRDFLYKLLVFFYLWFFPLWAQSSKSFTHSVGSAKKIVIRGYQGKLQIFPGSSDLLKVETKKQGQDSSGPWDFQVKEKGDVLEVSMKDSSSTEREDWSKVRSMGRVPGFQMRFTVPKRPIEIFWHEGQVVAHKWKESLNIQMTRGDIELKDGQGPLLLQLVQGRVKISGHKGKVELQSFGGQVSVDRTEGEWKLDNHSSSYKIKGHRGPMSLRNYNGFLDMSKIQGDLVVRNQNGKLRLNGFRGNFEAQIEKGSLQAKVESLGNFTVESEEASVVLNVPEKSGAQVSLRSQKGRVKGPKHLRKIQKGLWEEYRGRLKGQKQGNIKIVSKYGDIVLK